MAAGQLLSTAVLGLLVGTALALPAAHNPARRSTTTTTRTIITGGGSTSSTTSGPADPAAATNCAALAYDAGTSAYGYVSGVGSTEAAEAAALDICETNAAMAALVDCRIESSFCSDTQCVAAAWSMDWRQYAFELTPDTPTAVMSKSFGSCTQKVCGDPLGSWAPECDTGAPVCYVDLLLCGQQSAAAIYPVDIAWPVDIAIEGYVAQVDGVDSPQLPWTADTKNLMRMLLPETLPADQRDFSGDARAPEVDGNCGFSW